MWQATVEPYFTVLLATRKVSKHYKKNVTSNIVDQHKMTSPKWESHGNSKDLKIRLASAAQRDEIRYS